MPVARLAKQLDARIGITAVLHSWGSTMTHHPHVHMIVPGGISRDGSRWITKRPNFLLPVRVLSKLFRRLIIIEKRMAAHAAGQLTFHGAHAALVNTNAFAAYLAPLKRTRWHVYTKRPPELLSKGAGPKAVLADLARYTHRVAISNRRLIATDAKTVTFLVKDYRITGPGRDKTMTLVAPEFIRRFLIHVLPNGFHRIRHYGLLASGVKADNLGLARKLLDVASPAPEPEDLAAKPPTALKPCPCCGSAMRIIEVFTAGELERHRPAAMPAAIRLETSWPGQPHSPPLCRSVSLVHSRPRQRSSELPNRKAQIGFGPLVSGHPSLVATPARLRDHSGGRAISGCTRNGRVEIPIELPAAFPPTSRGFLP